MRHPIAVHTSVRNNVVQKVSSPDALVDEMLAGSGADDHLIAPDSAGRLLIHGLAGDDTLQGGAAADRIFGASGDDMIYGGDGNDAISGGDGSDGIHGGDGDDVIAGDDGDDFLEGDSGNDTMSGGDGDDYLNGGEDRDILFGGDGDDAIDGGDGDDTLYGGAGDDDLFGGDGSDVIVLRRGDGNDFIPGRLHWYGRNDKDVVRFDDLNANELRSVVEESNSRGAASIVVKYGESDQLNIPLVNSAVDAFQFADGSELSLAALRAMYAGENGTYLPTCSQSALLGFHLASPAGVGESLQPMGAAVRHPLAIAMSCQRTGCSHAAGIAE